MSSDENAHGEINPDVDNSENSAPKGPDMDETKKDKHGSYALNNSSDGEQYQWDSDNRQRDYNVGYVSETEVIYIDSDNESGPGPTVQQGSTAHSDLDVKPRCALNTDVIKKETDFVSSTTNTNRDLNFPVKPEVIVIQPDYEFVSNPDSSTMTECQIPVSGETDSAGDKEVEEKNDCVCHVVKFLLRKSKFNIKTGQSCSATSASNFKTLFGKHLSSTEILRLQEEMAAPEEDSNTDDNPAMDHEAGAGKEEKPTETPNTDTDGEGASPSGIVGQAGVTRSKLCEYC